MFFKRKRKPEPPKHEHSHIYNPYPNYVHIHERNHKYEFNKKRLLKDIKYLKSRCKNINYRKILRLSKKKFFDFLEKKIKKVNQLAFYIKNNNNNEKINNNDNKIDINNNDDKSNNKTNSFYYYLSKNILLKDIFKDTFNVLKQFYYDCCKFWNDSFWEQEKTWGQSRLLSIVYICMLLGAIIFFIISLCILFL
jgi:hypothetical protein